jgi:CheY-like chemotaxis protein
MKTLRKVLVVDDDPVVGRSFHRVLSNKGYAVVTAADGAEALAKIAAEDYDVVYTDIRMPGMDGIEVAENIKGRRPWLPIVIVSGYATAENEARAKAAGVSAVLRKPLSPEMIENSARDALLEKEAGELAVAVAVGTTAAPMPAALPAAAPVAAAREPIGKLKTLALLLAAPFAGLAYVILFPIAGLATLVGVTLWEGAKRVAERVSHVGTFARNVGLFIAAPFIGLAYAIALPFVGVGMLVWLGARALFDHGEPR